MSDSAPRISAFIQIEDARNKKIRLDGIALDGDTIEITSDTTLIIGRNPQIANLQFYDISEDSSVSRLHCTITFDEEYKRFMLTDEGSSNGSFINDEKLSPHEATQLHDGDIVRLGTLAHKGIEFKFTTAEDAGNRSTRLVVKPAKLPKGTAVNVGKLIKSVMHAVDEEDEESNAVDTNERDNVSTTVIPQYDVFISYSRQDVKLMQRVAEYLREEGKFRVWTDENLKPGTESWQIGVEVALEASLCVLVLMSPDAKQSPWVRRELNYAESRGKMLLPVLVEGNTNQSVPLVLAEHQYFDLRDDFEAQLPELTTMIRDKMAK